MSWLMNAIHQANRPKESVIEVLRKHLGGPREGRSRTEVHASDITKPEFCPRKWAFLDQKAVKAAPEYIATALDVTFQMGLAAETLVMEAWTGDSAFGNWRCQWCGDQRTMVARPHGFCNDGKYHHWKYRQLVIEAPEYGVTGAIDGLFDLGAPRLMIAEIKTLNPAAFEKIVAPEPEHRLRSNLYMKLIATSHHPYKDRINTTEARVLYISRGYGKMNAQWNEVLPFAEFIVKRDDADLTHVLQRAKALALFRDGQGMPSGICTTALDKYAKTCGQCQECFSGEFPAAFQIESLSV